MNLQKRVKAGAFRRKMHTRNRIRASRNYRPRLSVHKTAKHMYVQVIDDLSQKTLAAASTQSKELSGKVKNGGNVEAAKLVGELIGKKAVEAGVTDVAFDRGSFRFHGRVKALAESAREAGLKF